MQSYPNACILIVEDLPSDQQLIHYALEELGYQGQMDFLPSGQALVERLLEKKNPHEPLPDLILLDLSLDDIGGQQLLDRLKNNPRTCVIPVVIFTSLESSSATDTCYSLGAGGFIRKPTDFDQLKNHLEGIISFWLQESVQRSADPRRLRYRS